MAASRNSYTLESIGVVPDDTRTSAEVDRSPEHKLPKFKITRLNLRRVAESEEETLRTVCGAVREQRLSPEEEEAENCREMVVERSRPLRKRKRLVVAHHEAMAAEQDEETGGAKG